MSEAAKEEQAVDRTDLAEDRTLLANERTFASWIRTGLASVGVALGLHALLGTLEPLWVPKAIGTLFMLVAILIFWAAERRACLTERRMKAHEVVPFRTHRLRAIAYALILVSASLIATLWLLV
jgi:putative membrane protein